MKDSKIKEISEWYAALIMAECASGDTETDHCRRDDLLEKCLIELGAKEVAEASQKSEDAHGGYWYA